VAWAGDPLGKRGPKRKDPAEDDSQYDLNEEPAGSEGREIVAKFISSYSRRNHAMALRRFHSPPSRPALSPFGCRFSLFLHSSAGGHRLGTSRFGALQPPELRHRHFSPKASREQLAHGGVATFFSTPSLVTMESRRFCFCNDVRY